MATRVRNRAQPRAARRRVSAPLLACVLAGVLPVMPARAQAGAGTETATGSHAGSQAGSGSGAGAGAESGVTVLPDVNIVAQTPLLGTGLDADDLPQATTILKSGDVSRGGDADALRTLEQQVGGVTLDQAAGNPYQPTLMFHGFSASPLQGTAQGLAVYVNGVRFNQPFGDTVDWDILTDNAIAQIDLEQTNPVFGLNALGGALSVQLKNGFTAHGGDLLVEGGSFGKVEAQAEYGKQVGNYAVYAAGTALHEDGWRDLQSSDIHDFYGDVGWRDAASEVHLSLLAADTVLNGPGTTPVELLDADPEAAFTSPNAIANKDITATLTDSTDLDDDLTVQGNLYYAYFQQKVVNGNAANDAPCDDGSGLLCASPGVPSTTRGGGVIPDFLDGGPYSELDDQTTVSNGYGTSAQLIETHALFGRSNHLVVGASFDGAQNAFGATSYIGGLTPVTRVFVGPGEVIDEPGDNTPVRVGVSNAYGGIFATDTFSLTRRLKLTAAFRENLEAIDLADGSAPQQGVPSLSGNHEFDRFDPSVGAVYRLATWLSPYAGYAEANRAPTPAELSCASPQASCSLANFFVGDPDLKQVVARTIQVGLRGTLARGRATLDYDVDLFRTVLDDDILFVNSPVQGRAYFENVGGTERRGVDAALTLRIPNWRATLDYSYTEATFRSGFVDSSEDNPAADADGDITVEPGDRLPGVPTNLLKATLQYVASRWTAGATAVASSGTYLFGDEANLTPRLPAYVLVDLNGAFNLTRKIQLYGRIENIAGVRVSTYGTFSPTGSVPLVQAPGATDPRSVSLSEPRAGFGGVKVFF